MFGTELKLVVNRKYTQYTRGGTTPQLAGNDLTEWNVKRLGTSPDKSPGRLSEVSKGVI